MGIETASVQEQFFGVSDDILHLMHMPGYDQFANLSKLEHRLAEVETQTIIFPFQLLVFCYLSFQFRVAVFFTVLEIPFPHSFPFDAVGLQEPNGCLFRRLERCEDETLAAVEVFDRLHGHGLTLTLFQSYIFFLLRQAVADIVGCAHSFRGDKI